MDALAQKQARIRLSGPKNQEKGGEPSRRTQARDTSALRLPITPKIKESLKRKSQICTPRTCQRPRLLLPARSGTRQDCPGTVQKVCATTALGTASKGERAPRRDRDSPLCSRLGPGPPHPAPSLQRRPGKKVRGGRRSERNFPTVRQPVAEPRRSWAPPPPNPRLRGSAGGARAEAEPNLPGRPRGARVRPGPCPRRQPRPFPRRGGRQVRGGGGLGCAAAPAPVAKIPKIHAWGFPGDAVVENLPASAGDMGSSPGLGRSHMPRSSWAHEPQLLSLRFWSLCSPAREAVIVRGPRTAMKSDPRLPRLEKALAQKRRPNTAINK
ncbi:hypothetical protein J1605_010161 [Eschrichtius robustus]|uniref:Uncharacterized protein n=1 Tax=Eschrichtius robustus TaxID=9764 RepID=A0AB34GT30_ESCRO|nr:hypothetical protein J1605_010161 [Eschrichtius robustus]